MFRFRDRAAILEERSRRFLTTVAWLGGYVTPEQAQELAIRNSTTRVHFQLNDLESWGFIKRVAAYPAIYQITKSVTRLLGADLSARRQHTLETIQTRLLTVNFYLEAIRWPVEFVFDHISPNAHRLGKNRRLISKNLTLEKITYPDCAQL